MLMGYDDRDPHWRLGGGLLNPTRYYCNHRMVGADEGLGRSRLAPVAPSESHKRDMLTR